MDGHRPETSSWTPVRPFKKIHRVVLKPLGYFSCQLVILVLLEGEPSVHPKVEALPKGFVQIFNVGCFHFPSIATCHPVLDAEKHPLGLTLPPSCFTVVMVLCR